MRIALDIRFRTRSGGAAYARNLVPRLLAGADAHEFVLVRHAEQLVNGASHLPAIVCPPLSRASEIVWDQYRLPALLESAGIELYHALKLIGSVRARCLQLKVAHAINPSLFGTYPQRPSQHLYWSLLGNYGFRKADHLIAVSGYVRDFCVGTLGLPAERVTIIPNGIDPLFRVLEPAAHDVEWGTRRGRPFALVVGNVLAVKNQVTAVRAFAQIAERFPGHHLLLAGGTRDPYADRVRAAIRAAGLDQRVHLLGYVEPERLAQLYNAAEVLLMPSLTEGCPVALLEALACGVPIIGSRRGGIPEVVGEAARLIDDPMDVAAWATALEVLLWRGPERQALRDEALRRRHLYSWERTAAETLALYDRIDRTRHGALPAPDQIALPA